VWCYNGVTHIAGGERVRRASAGDPCSRLCYIRETVVYMRHITVRYNGKGRG